MVFLIYLFHISTSATAAYNSILPVQSWSLEILYLLKTILKSPVKLDKVPAVRHAVRVSATTDPSIQSASLGWNWMLYCSWFNPVTAWVFVPFLFTSLTWMFEPESVSVDFCTTCSDSVWLLQLRRQETWSSVSAGWEGCIETDGRCANQSVKCCMQAGTLWLHDQRGHSELLPGPGHCCKVESNPAGPTFSSQIEIHPCFSWTRL